MSQFSISQRGCYSLQQELDSAGEDYDLLCNLIIQFQITVKRFPRTPQDAISLIQKHIETVSRSFYNVRGQMLRRSELLIESLRKCRQHQISCQQFYESAVTEASKLNNLMVCQLSIFRPHFLKQMRERARRREEGRLKILVLGQICTGKSSILNIWMEGQYFPVGHGHCTKIPCEVQNDMTRHAYLYHDSTPWARPSASFELSTDPEDQSWKRVQKCIVNGYDQMSDSSEPLHKVVIKWPLRMFQTSQLSQLLSDLKKKEAAKARRPKFTMSEPATSRELEVSVDIYSKSEQTIVLRPPVSEHAIYNRSEQPDDLKPLNNTDEDTEVLKSPQNITSLKESISSPILEYKGVKVPALEKSTLPKSPRDVIKESSLPKSPIEASECSPESESEATTGKFTFDSLDVLSDSYDDTLKLINGITFVDAPGIYDTDESFLNLQPYIQSCDAYIFVISTAEHEGVERDRVMKLMEIVRKTCEERNNFFNPQCAIFLCNKWDIVDDDYKEELQDAVLRKLRECWPTVSSKQIYPISGSKKILREIQIGKVPALYEKFYYGICSFIETAARTSIESNCWWLTTFLEKLVVLQRKAKSIANYSRQQQDEVKRCLTEIKKSMLEINDRQNKTSQELTEDKEKALRGIQDRMKLLLKSKLGQLCDWNEDDIPVRENGLQWRNYQHELNRAIAKRLQSILVDDEETDAIIDKYEKEIKDKLYTMKKIITTEDAKVSYLQPLTAFIDIPTESNSILTKSKYPLLVLAVVATLPVAPLILIVWHIFEELTVPVLQDNEELFSRNPKEYMRRQTDIFVQRILKDRLSEIAEARIQSLSDNAKHMMQFFFTCIENRLKSIDEMDRQIEDEVVPLQNHKKLIELTMQLSRFYIKKVMKHDIHFDSLRVDTENPATTIGNGQFGLSYVVKGEYYDDQSNKVAVKVIKWPLGEEEAVFRECFLLRQLSQKSEDEKTNFVKFFGSTFDEYRETFKLMLVFELCDIDLAKLVQMDTMVLPSGNGVTFPGKDSQRGQGWNYFFHLARQAAKGLQFVHNNNIVHRDVKPGNFLIKFSGERTVVKIADVGLSRNVDLNTTTRIGTMIYSAPEVQLGLLHSYSADIYSLLVVLHELWYGQTVPFDLPERPRLNFYYPAPQLRDTRPPRNFEELMKAAWRHFPSERPNIGTVVECLNEFSKKYRYR